MNSKPLTIVHAAAEMAPFSKSGGLGIVIGSLPRTQQEFGHEVSIFIPYYEGVVNVDEHRISLVDGNIPIEVTGGIFDSIQLYQAEPVEGRPRVYLIGHHQYFSRRVNMYGDERENARFAIFDLGVLAAIKHIGIQPDVIHCHDWHTGLIPYFLKGRFKPDGYWNQTSTLFTIHNLTYQYGHNWWDTPAEMRDDGRSRLPEIGDPAFERVNFAKRAIINADTINAVSETYRTEIMTKDFGQELHRILKNREKNFFGIVNGIDHDAYNPHTDPGLVLRYGVSTAARRQTNKRALQLAYGLDPQKDVPLICMTSRVVEQKGFKLLAQIIQTVLRMPSQLIIMGDGDKEFTKFFQKVSRTYEQQFKIVAYDLNKETSLYAGADIFLLPSRFEPCGLNQLIAMRYGSVPVVHHIGGLADTVVDFDPRMRAGGSHRASKNSQNAQAGIMGNGFAFKNYQSRDLLVAIARAVETYKHRAPWKRLIASCMKQATSWEIPAQKYIDLYRQTMKSKRSTTRRRARTNTETVTQ